MSILIGVHEDRLAEFEALLGRPVDTVRVFASPTNAPGTSSPYTRARALALAGYEVQFSVKPTGGVSVSQIAAGAWDGAIDTVSSWMLTLPAPVNPRPSGGVSSGHQMTFFHEMDNDMAGSAYVPAANRVYSRWQAVAKPGVLWRYAIIMTGGFRGSPFNGRDPDAYWPTDPNVVIDFLGADYYNQRGAQLDQGDLWADPTRPDRDQADMAFMISKAQGHGAQLIFPEYASSVEDPAVNPTGWTKRRNWIQAGAGLWRLSPDIYSITYYEQDANDGRINWRISGGVMPPESGSMAAFDAWSSGTPPPPPPPPPPVGEFIPGVVKTPHRVKIGTGAGGS
jgi:hypothetical protein